ncbi:MAG: zf-HC2 domain-containing protein [Gemmatimonadales bacterium]
MTESQAPGDHLLVDEVAGYVAGTLPPSVRQRVEEHLADCAECTAELVAVDRLRPPGPSRVRWIALGAAAAVAGIVLLGPSLIRRPPADGAPLRGTNPPATTNAVAPADGAELRGGADLIWHAIPGATAYRVSVSRVDGDSVWAATTRDTTLGTDEALLRAGPGSYYWYVDALLDDGRSVAGPAHEFRLGP